MPKSKHYNNCSNTKNTNISAEDIKLFRDTMESMKSMGSIESTISSRNLNNHLNNYSTNHSNTSVDFDKDKSSPDKLNPNQANSFTDSFNKYSKTNSTKQSKFLNYRLITDAIYSASDKIFYNNTSTKIIKKMQQGSILIDATIDLHGQTLEESCISLANFIYYHQHKNYLHIIHGKGFNANNMSRLKTQVAIYLQDHPQIVAVCSCPNFAGGTGAVFAKLKHKI